MEGMAPALIINHTESYLKFIEHDLSEYLDEMLVVSSKLHVEILISYSFFLFFFVEKYYHLNTKCFLPGLLQLILLLFIGI